MKFTNGFEAITEAVLLISLSTLWNVRRGATVLRSSA